MLPLTVRDVPMALNYLLHRHQIALMQTRSGQCASARAAHRGLAAGYVARIQTLRSDLGAAPVDVLRVT